MSSIIKPRRAHWKEVGLKRCGHDCVGRICTNAKGSLDWAKEGHSVRRHKKSWKAHPQCTMACPRYNKIQKALESRTGQSATPTVGSTTPSEGSYHGEAMDLDMAGPSNFQDDTAMEIDEPGPSRFLTRLQKHCLKAPVQVDVPGPSTIRLEAAVQVDEPGPLTIHLEGR